jgi:hypothetical protein
VSNSVRSFASAFAGIFGGNIFLPLMAVLVLLCPFSSHWSTGVR